MFLKPYKLRSNAPLKGSESKRLRQRVEKAFPDATAEQLSLVIPAKSAVTQLKLTTHGGTQTNVFCVDKLPMFFELESGELAPTLYALWLVPSLLPYFTTHREVLPKLTNGAELMLPGVVPKGTGMNMYGRYRQGQLIAVNLVSNESAVAVGYLPRSSDDLYMCGRQGVAVKMLHIFGDKLWGHEPTLIQQVPLKKAAPLTKDDFPELGTKQDKQKKDENVKLTLADIVASTQMTDTINREPTLPDVERLEISSSEIDIETNKNISIENGENVVVEESKAGSETTPEMILKNAFLAALKNHGKNLQLPLLTSNFYRLYVVPEAPQPIDLKKTKYKKLSNFLNEMIDQGFIVVREESKGVDKITSIDLDHPEVINFITDFKPPKQAADGEQQDQPLFRSELTETYIVSDETAPFFAKMNFKRGEGVPTAQIKKIIREYISKHNLPKADATDGTIQLDETLEKLCNSKTATVSQICSAITSKMEYSYQMCELKNVASNKPLIQMSLATRSGNKKVTLISNVECYGIIVPEFIKLCKQGAAASTTIVKLPHQKAEQLQIQGNQVRFVYNLLTETYKVPPKCILGLELAKDGKKHKKK
ncbi:PREDICTED: eukaryotic translation initiation factor 2D [Bactrocera latifrons]|uniref:Eukaryotic translation initiation factor 2D n=1 Tax=Bactrocera latifrons TaxID=174628 RepID=A0A0K8VH60_BACLA|nr:PREDICTED: eukaryotic translation initiation factor 2D [Bactrocera latifrons]